MVVLLSAALASAASMSIHAKVPFQFVLEGKTFPSGQYDFIEGTNSDTIRVASENGNPSGLAMVVTRLASAIHTTPHAGDVVFDEVGNKCFLSEVWFTGADGFLVHVTKGKHEHRTVKGSS